MNRRGFFGRVLGGAAAAVAAPFLPADPTWRRLGTVKSSGLMFHRDAFALAMAPLDRGDVIEIDGVKYDVLGGVTSDLSTGYGWHTKTLIPKT